MLSSFFMGSFSLSICFFPQLSCFMASFPTFLNLISKILDSPLPSVTSALNSPSWAWIQSPTYFTPTPWLLRATVSSSTSWAVQCSSVYGFQIRLRGLCCSPKDIGAFCLPRRSLARTVSFCQPTYVSNFTEKCEVFPLSNYCPDIFNEIWEFISTCSFLPLLFLIFTVFFFT